MAEFGVGVHAPAVLIVSFVPILLIAVAYKYLNRADPDAGTTFAWTTRAFGPGMGWLNGWAIFLADVLVMASLSDIAAIYTFKLFGFTELGESKAAIVVAAILWIAIMTWICWRGIELSARTQQFLLGFEMVTLIIFAVEDSTLLVDTPLYGVAALAAALIGYCLMGQLIRVRRIPAIVGIRGSSHPETSFPSTSSFSFRLLRTV